MTDEERADWLAKGTPVHVETAGSVARIGGIMVREWSQFERVASGVLDHHDVEHPHGFYVAEVILRPRPEEGVPE